MWSGHVASPDSVSPKFDLEDARIKISKVPMFELKFAVIRSHSAKVAFRVPIPASALGPRSTPDQSQRR